MLYLIIGLFALAAILGLIIINALIKKRETPKPAVLAHGLLAVTGLGLLIYYAIQNPENYPQVSIILFGVAALGGIYLFYNDMRKKPGPLGLAVIHALAAVVAFGLLLVFVIG
jgi:FtsH-binding integral membrane protein